MDFAISQPAGLAVDWTEFARLLAKDSAKLWESKCVSSSAPKKLPTVLMRRVDGIELMTVMVQPMPIADDSASSNNNIGAAASPHINLYLIDDSPTSRSSIVNAVAGIECNCIEFNTLERFMGLVQKEPTGIILADFYGRIGHEFEGINSIESEPLGMRLLEYVSSKNWDCPVLFVSENQDIQSCSAAYAAGAFAYLPKPFVGRDLVEKIQKSLELCRNRAFEKLRKQEIAEKLNLLTSREREVLEQLVAGHSMKAIASNSGTSFQAVARHRQRILEKLRLEGDVALVRWFYNLSGI